MLSHAEPQNVAHKRGPRAQRHVCSHCSRNFKRAEHLTRHLRTHTREKPFTCDCGAAFTRRDLLTRHWRISQHDSNNRHSDASSPGTIEQQRPLEPRVSSALHDGPADSTFGSIGTEACLPLSQEVGNGVDLPGPPYLDAHDHIIPQVQHEPYHDEGFDDFRDFVNFIDGVGLSAQWTPEYDLDWLRIVDHNHEPHRQSREPEDQPVSEGEDIGSPFGTWLPSAPADNEVVNPRDDPRERGTNSRTYNVTEEQRNSLSSLLESFSPLISDFQLPSRHALTRYLTAFFGGFHSHFPFIHRPTYRPSCSPLELTLAMCSAGAQYCFERRCAERLFQVSKAVVFERLRQEESHFGSQTMAFVHLNQPQSARAVPGAGRCGPWAPLDIAKTLLILVGYATWETKDILQQAFALRGLMVQCLRDIGLQEESQPISASSSRAVVWDQWIQRESSRRTKLVAFCYINVHSIAYNIHPLLWSSELHLRLPCSTQEWQASSASQWTALQREQKEDQMLFQQALSILLQGTTGVDSVHPVPSPLGNYILLHALLQRIHIVRELSFPATTPATMHSTELQTIGRGLRSWTLMWQQAPESMLDPNNESGPVPFTSSALLVVAYVRLSLNIGPFRKLETRDPDAIAAALAQAPEIERNDNLLSALLYSTHALSIPVRLGIDRVARSQAFFWSVQHAISSFECAIFLGKWLCSLPSPLQDGTLSKSEHRILYWVRCIIKEAYAVVDFDEVELPVPVEPFQLGLAVLNIWCRFFRGNTQWQFVVNLGISIEKHMKTL